MKKKTTYYVVFKLSLSWEYNLSIHIIQLLYSSYILCSGTCHFKYPKLGMFMFIHAETDVYYNIQNIN